MAVKLWIQVPSHQASIDADPSAVDAIGDTKPGANPVSSPAGGAVRRTAPISTDIPTSRDHPTTMSDDKHPAPRARAVGINHIALEVGDIDEALDFYGSFLEFEITRRSEDAAFIYFGDQFINFSRGRRQGPDDDRHFGIAVDDKDLVRRRLAEMGVELLDGRFLDFLDPWGNRVEVTTYTNIQFTKADNVLRGMGLGHLRKTDQAIEELRRKGMAP